MRIQHKKKKTSSTKYTTQVAITIVPTQTQCFNLNYGHRGSLFELQLGLVTTPLNPGRLLKKHPVQATL